MFNISQLLLIQVNNFIPTKTDGANRVEVGILISIQEVLYSDPDQEPGYLNESPVFLSQPLQKNDVIMLLFGPISCPLVSVPVLLSVTYLIARQIS
jgi:hypothetical protein